MSITRSVSKSILRNQVNKRFNKDSLANYDLWNSLYTK